MILPALKLKKNVKNLQSVKNIIKTNSSKDIKRAYFFAKKIHKGHKRNSGEPYFFHLVETANNILSWLTPIRLTGEIEELVIAALLHDSVEYRKVELKVIESKFGKNVKKLVAGVSDLRSGSIKNTEEKNLNFIARKGYLDPKVFVIKLADRLHNMRTHSFLPREKQVPKALETLNVYAKLAESMGMWQVKKELEDLCFFYINPKKFREIKSKLIHDPRLNENFSPGLVSKLKKIFSRVDLKCSIVAHTNSIYKLYLKKETALVKGEESLSGFSKIPDVITFSVILPGDDIMFLYLMLGVLHTSEKFRQYVNADAIKDYINSPQPNKYSSLQTMLELPQGNVEISFVTREKEDFNNFGIITLIKSGGADLSEYKRNIIFDEEQVAWFMPLNSIYLDYVYLKGVGVHATGVIANGKGRKLSEKIENGSKVFIKINTTKTRSVNSRLFGKCLPSTQKLIQKQINLARRDMLLQKGKTILEKILKRHGILDLKDLKPARNAVIFSLVLEDTNDLYFRISSGNINPQKVTDILNIHGITKKALNLTTLRITGKDKPGILSEVATIIKNLNGNILNTALEKTTNHSKSYFVLRLLLNGLTPASEKSLYSQIAKKSYVEKAEVV